MKFRHKITVAIICLLTVTAAALCMGRYNISISDLIGFIASGRSEDPMLNTVIVNVRIPRAVMAILVGAGLSAAGASYQAMFGNPLVSAHVLGVSYSAGFGAALGILLFENFRIVQIMSVIFGFAGMGLTYFLSTRKKQSGTLILVLSGIIVGAVFEALTSFIKYIADPEEKLPAITYWLMGSLSGSSAADIRYTLPFIGAAVLVLFFIRWRMNVISLPEDEAASMGINIRSTRLVIIIATTVIVASTVSVCGVISFVGLAVPHLTRMISGNDHRFLIPMTILTGAIYMVVIDTCARCLTAAEIPLSILTALIGAPVFAVMLLKTGGKWDA